MRKDRHEQLRRIARLNKFVLVVALLWTVASFALLLTATRKFAQQEQYGIARTATYTVSHHTLLEL